MYLAFPVDNFFLSKVASLISSKKFYGILMGYSKIIWKVPSLQGGVASDPLYK